jgi:hypothetical protein
MEGLDNIIREACRWDTAAWMEGFGSIRLKSGELRQRPRANVYQLRINAAIKAAHEAGRPCRLVCLKPRQKGSSTFSVAAAYRRLQAKPARGLIAGGAHFQGQNLFKILRTYAENDELDPGTCKVMDMGARFKNGSEMERITLANSNAGRSGTYQVVVITEVAYLSDEGVANADEVLNGLLKCVPYEPDTLIVEESTAKGASGFFYDRWGKSITLEEFSAGKNGYVRIFAAWFEFDDSRLEPSGEGIASEADLTDKERELAAKWKLDLDQVAWMRWAIREECKGDFDRFCQDYPFDPESAFLKSGRGRFSVEGLAHQDSVAKVNPREFGVLEYRAAGDYVQWVGCGEGEARCVKWETPRAGCRYLLAVDPMTGASQTGGDDPDSHGVFVIRAGYLEHGQWHEPAVVMRNMLVPDGNRFGCWWDIDVLEEEIWRMARYWQAVVVPEMNMDRGLVELLKLRGDVSIYEREIFNRREQVRTKALGWMTDIRTRPMVIENLARMVRESGRGGFGEGIEVRCPWALKQMRNFVVKPNGRAEAAVGHHDDDVLALAIGAYVLDAAVPWVPRERVRGVVRPVTRAGQWD